MDEKTQDTTTALVAEKLSSRFADDRGPFSEDEVVEVVEDTAEKLRDAPVQTFVPIITENKARNELQDHAEARRDDRP
jgi:hypothetical protein